MALDQIVAYKHRLLEQKRSAIEALKASLKPSQRKLSYALKKEKSAFICEVKLASPSQGVIRSDVEVGDVAQMYAPFADAISVLADEEFFSGSYAFVERVSSLNLRPVLCKDVVVSPLQVYEARHFGADAVLLMLSVLDDESYRVCAEAALRLGMDFICEVHTEQEMERAKKLKAAIIGINNRNLKTLEIDLENTERLLSFAPKDALLISESGFSKRHQLKRFSGRVNGFLIGTSLMRAKRIDLALRELLFGRVKICGLTNAEDALAAYRLGAYYGGLNFSSHSKRMVFIEEASSIKKNIPLKWGGVFVNQSLEEVSDIAKKLSLDFVQLHGDEESDYVGDLRRLISNDCEIWKAYRIKDSLNMPRKGHADRLLFDSFSEGDYGGSGKAFDWSLLRDEKERDGYIIAGGINAKNIEAASALSPFAIDIASGVEESPRKKSHAMMEEIFLKLRP